MIHLNGNLLCAVDIETTGLDPYKNEIYEIVILPLDHMLRPNPRYMPFDTFLRPDNTDAIDWEGMKKNNNQSQVVKACEKGIDPCDAAEYLVQWFEKLNLPERKLIMPLAQNWAGIDKVFIQNWLGPLTYQQIFHGHYRDTMTTALFLNDRAEAASEQIPFPKVNLTYLLSQLKIEVDGRAHSAMDDCLRTAKVYERLIRFF